MACSHKKDISSEMRDSAVLDGGISEKLWSSGCSCWAEGTTWYLVLFAERKGELHIGKEGTYEKSSWRARSGPAYCIMVQLAVST